MKLTLKPFNAILLATALFFGSVSVGHASCTQADLAGSWQGFGMSGKGTVALCTLVFSAAGGLDVGTKCAYRDLNSGLQIAIKPTGALLVNGTSCRYVGNVNTAVNGQIARVTGGLSIDKQTFIGMGFIQPSFAAAGEGFNFTALRQ